MTFRMSEQQAEYPFVMINDKGEKIVRIHGDGSIELEGTPNDAAKHFWNSFSNLFSEAVQAHVAGKLDEFNKDIKNTVHGKA